jgi:hypothetical protein
VVLDSAGIPVSLEHFDQSAGVVAKQVWPTYMLPFGKRSFHEVAGVGVIFFTEKNGRLANGTKIKPNHNNLNLYRYAC